MNVCDLHTQYSQNLNKLSHCSGAKAYHVLTNLVESGFDIVKRYEQTQNIILHELFLRRVFFDLLNAISDPLINIFIRRMCLDFLHKPLLALKRFYKTTHGTLNSYYKLETEMRTISFEYLSSEK